MCFGSRRPVPRSARSTSLRRASSRPRCVTAWRSSTWPNSSSPTTTGATLRTEREIRTDRWHERHAGTRHPARGRTPDGELTLRNGKVIAIELDLTPKRSKDFERILRAYRQEKFDKVWWYVLPGVVPRVTKLVNENRVDDFIEVRSWTPAIRRRLTRPECRSDSGPMFGANSDNKVRSHVVGDGPVTLVTGRSAAAGQWEMSAGCLPPGGGPLTSTVDR